MTEICLECPYCASIPGVSPVQSSEGVSGFDAPVYIDEDFVVVPTLGLLRPGYLLLVSRSHVDSMGALALSTGLDPWRRARAIIRALEQKWGQYVAVESTTGTQGGRGSGGCVSHAHIHLIPAGPSLVRQLRREVQGELVYEAGKELGLGSYFAYQTPDGQLRVSRQRMQSQWVRRALASDLGVPEDFDWGVVSGAQYLEETIKGALWCLSSVQSQGQLAIKGLLIDSGNRILLAQRTLNGTDLFEMPGGRIETGETAGACFTREVAEETGVVAEIGPFLGAWNWWRGGELFVAHAFGGEIINHSISVTRQPLGEDLARARWATLGELGALSIRPEQMRFIQLSLARKNIAYSRW